MRTTSIGVTVTENNHKPQLVFADTINKKKKQKIKELNLILLYIQCNKIIEDEGCPNCIE